MSVTVKHLIAKAVLDPAFKKALIADFEGVSKKEGVKLTREQIHSFSHVTEKDWDLVESVIGDTLIPTCACRVT